MKKHRKCKKIIAFVTVLFIDVYKRQCVKVREQTNMNRKEFAEWLGIPYRTMQDWERGVSEVPDYVLNLIAVSYTHLSSRSASSSEQSFIRASGEVATSHNFSFVR